MGQYAVNKSVSEAVNGGGLTELASSPASLPTGATPAGVVVT